jgi:hypothetical protein
MAVSFSTVGLIEALKQVPLPTTFLRDTFVKNENTGFSFKKQLNKYQGGAGISVYTDRNSPPNPLEKRSYTGEEYVAPYIYESVTITTRDLDEAGINENIYNSDPSDQYLDLVNLKVAELEHRATNKEEAMIAESLQTGAIVVSGNGVQTYTIDYGMRATHELTLTGGDVWGSTTEDKDAQLRAWCNLPVQRGCAQPTMLICDKLSASLLLKDSALNARLDNRSIDAGSLVYKQMEGQNAQQVGTIRGAGYVLDLIIYNGGYWNSSGVWANYMEDNTILLASRNVRFDMEYCRLENMQSGFKGKRFFNYVPDPHGRGIEITLESSPLPMFIQPDGIVTVDVA